MKENGSRLLDNKKIKNRIVFYTMLLVLFVIVNIVVSFAYLRGRANNNESVSTIAIEGVGEINVTYSSNTPNIVVEDILPGYETVKKFSVTSNISSGGTLYKRGIWYQIRLVVDTNGFMSESLVYSLSLDDNSSTDGITALPVDKISIPNGANSDGILVGTGYFSSDNVSHIYNLKINYVNLEDVDQSNDYQKKFAAHVVIDNPRYVNLTFDLDGGSFENLNLNSNSTMKIAANSTINLPVPTKEKYVFAGWKVVSGDVGVNSTVITTSDSDIKLKVLWINGVFDYTGGEQEFIAELDGYYKLEAWGAQGGSIKDYLGGNGAYVNGVILLNMNEVLRINVGGQGSTSTPAVINTITGGYNGGGTGYISRTSCTQSCASGGGATDITLGIDGLSDAETLNSRILVAAGGGGAYSEYCSTSDYAYINGGAGGNLIGVTPIYSSKAGYSNLNPTGGTQINGGQGLADWNVTSYTTSYIGKFGEGGTGEGSGGSYSGGGGGYYGGASGKWQPGAGGSSFISGYAGTNAITSSTDRTHTNNTLHYSNKYFINGKMETGINTGNGKAKISYLGPSYPKKNNKLNNVRYVKDCINGSTSSTNNHWTELQAIYNGLNVAKGKSIAGTSTQNSSYPYSRITDGNITYSEYAQAGTSGSLQCVTVDLTETYDLDEIAVWHYYGDTRSYNNHSLYVSSDNETWTTLIDNVSGVTETPNGIRVSAYE